MNYPTQRNPLLDLFWSAVAAALFAAWLCTPARAQESAGAIGDRLLERIEQIGDRIGDERTGLVGAIREGVAEARAGREFGERFSARLERAGERFERLTNAVRALFWLVVLVVVAYIVGKVVEVVKAMRRQVA